jgi:hypothetical protein
VNDDDASEIETGSWLPCPTFRDNSNNNNNNNNNVQ